MFLYDDIIFTFDLDWCSDEVLSYTLDLIEKYNVKAIFFVTHKTKLLERMRKNPNIELGIHPNFNFLLNGDFRYGKNINEVIKYYKDIIPEAKSVRNHSITQNSIILDGFYKYGLKYDFNIFIPFTSNIKLKPYKDEVSGLIRVPYFWEDDVHCISEWDWDIKKFLNYEGLKVFNFHPIHIFLNTEKIERYENAKLYLQNYKELKKFVNKKKYGIKNFFLDLIENIKKGLK
jgi:hypothetical protein